MAEWLLIDMDLPEDVQVAGFQSLVASRRETNTTGRHHLLSPPVIQLAEPKDFDQSDHIHPTPFSFLLIRLNFHLTTLSSLE